MSTINSILAIVCIIISSLNPFLPLMFLAGNSTPSMEELLEDAGNNIGVVDDIEYGYNINGFLTVELDGYCTVDIPQSHWQLVSSELNTSTQKYYKYKDDKTRLLMGYVTKLDDQTDIPGYIVQKAANVNMVTNNRETIEYGNGNWTEVYSSEPIDNSNVIVYYKLDKNSTAAFWMRATKNVDFTDQNEEEFEEVMTKIINSLNVYYIGGNLFDTPKTGIYSEITDDDGNTSEYKENSDDNTVFQGRGGFVANANISNNWKDMEIIIDNNKFKLPATMEDFYNAGYSIYQANITSETTVPIASNINFKIVNNKGTVLTLWVSNTSADSLKTINECIVEALEIDSAKFISVSEALNQITEVVEQSDNTDEEEDIGGEDFDENDENWGEDEYDIDNPDEDNTTDEQEPEDDTSIESINASHGLIIAGGITWDVYTDDLKDYYGACTVHNYDATRVMLEYKSGNYYMLLRIGTLKGIESVYISINGK